MDPSPPRAGRRGPRRSPGWPGPAQLAGSSAPPPRRPAIRHERRRSLLAQLADHHHTLRPRSQIPRSAVRRAGRVPEVPGVGSDRGPAVPAVPGYGPHQQRGGGLAMASGRPRQPNDPSVMASVEAAMSTVARPRIIARMWHWRYEVGLIAGMLLGTVGIGVTL